MQNIQIYKKLQGKLVRAAYRVWCGRMQKGCVCWRSKGPLKGKELTVVFCVNLQQGNEKSASESRRQYPR